MKFLVLLGLAFAAAEATSVFERTFKELHKGPPVDERAKDAVTLEEQWFEAKLDHFDASNTKTWKMRYFENKEHYEGGGPLFIYVGGEWTIDPRSIMRGHIVDMAKEHHGVLFYTEHRFYGKSRPTDDLTTESLQYLNVKQALHDLADFIVEQKREYWFSKKVILVGGSYSATMVTWFQQLFPNLVDGTWASSAPLLAKVNFLEYKEVAGESYKLVGGEECYNRIQNGVAALEELVDSNRGAQVKSLFKLCDNIDFTNNLDVWTLFDGIGNILAGAVQNHNGSSIQLICSEIMSGEDDLDGVVKYLYRRIFNPQYSCTDMTYSGLLEYLGSSQYTDDGSMRQWIYQTCTEYGWYQSSHSQKQPFGTKFPADLYITLCGHAYGSHLTPSAINKNIAATNKFFGGLKAKVDNLYMTHGQLDPWRAMGVQDKKKSTIIPLHSHCKDFGSIRADDHPELRASKERIAELVRQWVK